MKMQTFPPRVMNSMNLFGKNLDKEIVVVAELGINHGGSLNWIKEMLVELKDCGANAVKFQLFTPDLYSSRSNTKRHQFLQNVFISKNDFLQIISFADNLSMPIFATPLSHDWVDFVAENCGVIKIASGDFTFEATVKAALTSNAKVIASTGAASVDEIMNFLKIARSLRVNVEDTVALLHCIAAYPPPLTEANLRSIPFLRELTNLEIGFSCHFMQDAPLYASLALGAKIFEIHITDDRKRTDIRDHELSRTPSELGVIIENLNAVNESLRQNIRVVQPTELEIVSVIRKGIVYCRDLPSGHVLTSKDLDFARPLDSRIPDIDSVLGQRLCRSVSAYHSVSPQDFSELVQEV